MLESGKPLLQNVVSFIGDFFYVIINLKTGSGQGVFILLFLTEGYLPNVQGWNTRFQVEQQNLKGLFSEKSFKCPQCHSIQLLMDASDMDYNVYSTYVMAPSQVSKITHRLGLIPTDSPPRLCLELHPKETQRGDA